ncbi:MAG: DNA translocase FtsK [Bacteroidetes bacterium]|nr:DNA translocase FtsK [Bacteroidota bacterium]
MIGTAGSFLVLIASLVITLVYATNSDLRTTYGIVRGFLLMVYQKIRTSIERRHGVIAERNGNDDVAPAGQTAGNGPVSVAAAETADNEPARMVRRMRTALHEEPRISRPATASQEIASQHPHVNDVGAIPLPSPIAAAVEPRVAPAPKPEPVRPAEAPRAQSPAQPLLNDPLLTDAARRAMEREAAQAGTENRNPKPEDDAVAIVHGVPVPVHAAAVVNRLTLNVQEGETVADLETEDDGELIERRRDEQIRYTPPSIDLLVPQSEDADVKDDELKENGRILQEKLATFNIQIENLTVTPGPVVTLYEFVPAAGIKLSQIESLQDDIALALKARGIRIIAPIPGKGTVGVEIPNHKPAMVRIRSVINTTKFREAVHRLPLALGKTTVGEVFCDDLSKMPHLLIAGATGSGKSVGVNAILTSLLYKMHPSDLKFVVIDPKKIELTQYRALRSHFLAKCPDIDEDIITNPQNAVIALKSLEMEMDRRYDILAKVGQRNIFDYNVKVAEGKYSEATDFHHVKLPYIVLILDELADLMITAAKEVEEPIARLAQLARAIGIHLIVATQRPSVDVLTGVIKANFPARIAYQVASKIDSRTILDMNGAEQLLGNGDMLYLPAGQPKPLRLQNAFVSTEEVEEICNHIGDQKGYTYPYMLPSVLEKKGKAGMSGGGERDDLFDEAARLVVRHQQGSVSLIQRRLKVGYSRAARIVDELEMAGIVGPFDGSKARAVLLESEAELEAFL